MRHRRLLSAVILCLLAKLFELRSASALNTKDLTSHRKHIKRSSAHAYESHRVPTAAANSSVGTASGFDADIANRGNDKTHGGREDRLSAAPYDAGHTGYTATHVTTKVTQVYDVKSGQENEWQTTEGQSASDGNTVGDSTVSAGEGVLGKRQIQETLSDEPMLAGTLPPDMRGTTLPVDGGQSTDVTTKPSAPAQESSAPLSIPAPPSIPLPTSSQE